MTDKDKPLKIEFAPGCFDNFDGTQEELDQLVQDIQNMFASKSREEIEAESQELTDEAFEELPDEVKMQIIRSFAQELGLGDDDIDLPPDTGRTLQ